MATVIIAGSRTIQDMATVRAAIIWSGWEHEIAEVVSGMARVFDPKTNKMVDTVDTLAVLWAESRGIPTSKFYAKWREHGYDAGFIRNGDMAHYASMADDGRLLAVWDGKSNGTGDMVWKAKQAGLLVKVYCEKGL